MSLRARPPYLPLLIALVAATACELPADGDAVPAAWPDAVPTDFVVTPHGYFHPSCVLAAGIDGPVRADGLMATLDPSSGAAIPCGHPSFDRAGLERGVPLAAALAEEPPPQVNGWLVSAYSTQTAVQRLSATWTVPEDPAVDGAVLYYFPGLESQAVETILQPVLGWYAGSWDIASWNCCTDGNISHADPVAVAAGHVIDGSMVGSSCDASGVCASWRVTTTDRTTGQSSVYDTTTGLPMNWSFGGAFEAYWIDSCDQYSRTPSVAFRDIQGTGTDGSALDSGWTNWDLSAGTSPACRYHVTSAPHTVIVSADGGARTSPTDPRVFDAGYYLSRYGDLQAAFGADHQAAAQHWINNGRFEGRVAAPGFDVGYYLASYGDLQAAFGSNYPAAIDHFLAWGLREGRVASRVFSPASYLGRYPDLQNAFGTTGYEAAMAHWVSNGIGEGRQGSDEFAPAYYLAANPDVAAVFGASNFAAAIWHWQLYGIHEGRRGVP